MQEAYQLVVHPSQRLVGTGGKEEKDEVGGHVLSGADNLTHGMGADGNILEEDDKDAKEDYPDGYIIDVPEGPADNEFSRQPKAPPASCLGDERAALRRDATRGTIATSAAFCAP